MFEKIVIKKSIDGPTITAGEIAEALLFYQNVHLILDHASLSSLIDKIGMQSILRVLSLPFVKTTYFEDLTGAHTKPTPSGPEYSLVSFKLSGHKDIGQLHTKQQRFKYLLERKGYAKAQAKRFCLRFFKLVHMQNLENNAYVDGGIINFATSELSDQEFIFKSSKVIAERLLQEEVSEQSHIFKVIPVNQKFKVDTNIDFDLINNRQKETNQSAGTYTSAHILSEILSASSSLIFASHYGGDFYTSESESKIIQLKQSLLLKRSQINSGEIANFQTLVLSDSPNIAHAINSGERDFGEFMTLLFKAHKFKTWLRGQSPDHSLISNYLEDISKEHWISSLSGKTLRYVFSGVSGMINPLTGLAYSAFDLFLLEKIGTGWNPNQFVTKHMKPFVNTEE